MQNFQFNKNVNSDTNEVTICPQIALSYIANSYKLEQRSL